MCVDACVHPRMRACVRMRAYARLCVFMCVGALVYVCVSEGQFSLDKHKN